MRDPVGQHDEVSIDRVSLFSEELLGRLRRQDSWWRSDRSPLHHVAFDESWRDLQIWLEKVLLEHEPRERDHFVRRLDTDEHYIQTLHELAAAALLRDSGYRVTYEPDIGGKTPDWLATSASTGQQVIVEVVTRTNPTAKERRRWLQLHERLEKIPSPWAVFMISGRRTAPPHDVLRKVAITLRPWLADPKRQSGDEIDVLGLRFQIRYSGADRTAFVVPNPESGPVDLDEIVSKVRDKAKAYRTVVERTNLPFVVVACADTLTGHNEHTLATALSGRRTIHFNIDFGTSGPSEPIPMNSEVDPPRRLNDLPDHLSAVMWLSFLRGENPRWTQFTIPHAQHPIATGALGAEGDVELS